MARRVRLVGCRQHNLKNLSLSIPKDGLVAITGVSGAGKSSLAFDTIFAEGQRRYVESLSMAARSSLVQMPRPEIDMVEGLSPTLAVSQKAIRTPPRSTVGTQTEVYDLLSALFGHLCEQWSPRGGCKLERFTAQEMVDAIVDGYPEGSRLQILAPSRGNEKTREWLQRLGFQRLRIDGEIVDIADAGELPDEVEVVIDRLVLREGTRQRISDSVQLALQVGRDRILVDHEGEGRLLAKRYICPVTGERFERLHASDFNFHSPRAACPLCLGLGGGERLAYPEQLFSPHDGVSSQVDHLLTYFPKTSAALIERAWYAWLESSELDPTTPWNQIDEQGELLYGSDRSLEIVVDGERLQTRWKGWVEYIAEELERRGDRSRLSQLSVVEWCECRLCSGGRLREQALHCRLRGHTLPQLCQLSLEELRQEIESWEFAGSEEQIARELVPGLLARIDCLIQLGLGYLSLDRSSRSLSTGELQRVELATQIGSQLSGVLYILDEPSTGLHRSEVVRLLETIERLRELGNSILLVEHDPLILSKASHLVELGPGAGLQGGKITFQGSYEKLLTDRKSVTGHYLSGRRAIAPHTPRKPTGRSYKATGISCHNLREFCVEIPLGVMVGFCGVSGSGKSTLVSDVLSRDIPKLLASSDREKIDPIRRVITVGQGRMAPSIRSIPATYIGAMTPLRLLFAETRLARARGYTPTHFSLNRRGGRCESCEGLGKRRIPIDFLPDLWAPCEACGGRRFTDEILQVTWKGRSIADLLESSAAEAAKLFEAQPAIGEKLALMCELGLDYLQLGQPFPTLSGGEIQRLQLVSELAKRSAEPTLYLLDEPSSGLHLSDIEKLVAILHRLVDRGHSVWLIEHNVALLEQCDWLIELGPGGGPAGGELIFEGAPALLKKADTPTARVLR